MSLVVESPGGFSFHENQPFQKDACVFYFYFLDEKLGLQESVCFNFNMISKRVEI